MLGNLHVRFGVGAGVKIPGLHHFILARYGRSFARLRFHVGPGGDIELPVGVDYSSPFPASDHAAWDKEYAACVQQLAPADILPAVRHDTFANRFDLELFDGRNGSDHYFDDDQDFFDSLADKADFELEEFLSQ